MANRVNPPKQVTLPVEVSKNLPLRRAFDDVYYILFQMWKRLGGGEDWVDDALFGLYEFDDIEKTDVNQSIVDNEDIVTTDINYTTFQNQIVICDNSLTVFLNDKPEDRERAKVIVTNGDVEINGNGKLINKKEYQKVIFKNLVTVASVDCVYILELDEWFII